MTEEQGYTMRLSLNVLNHLGINLYSNTASVLSEVVANAWDADAKIVEIMVEKTDEQLNKITIIDNGIGMSREDINEKFLFVGYRRRYVEGGKTPDGRKPMGRKGIGKLSLFSIAGVIDVYSIKENECSSFRLDVEEINHILSEEKPSNLELYKPTLIPYDESHKRGTKIVLTSLKRKITRASVPALRKKIARRFGIGLLNQMEVFVNNQVISITDRDYFKKLEYLWQYGKDEDVGKCPNLAEGGKHTCLGSYDKDGEASVQGEYKIRGWFGMVHHTTDLKKSTASQEGDDENLNQVSIFVRGKLAVEDILEKLGINSMYARYIIGEIHADFLDDDEEEDIATSSRQKIDEDAPRYRLLKKILRDEIVRAGGKRDKDKEKKGEDALKSHFPDISEWLEGLKKDTRAKARKFFGDINKLGVEKSQKKDVFRHGVLAFENYRLRDALSSLEKISLDNLKEFLDVASEIDDLEASYYYEIARERMSIIKKLKEITEGSNEIERIIQEYLFDHLWLLDPAWDRGSIPIMEERVAKAFENVQLSESERRGRVDIKYRTVGGAHVIVELKRHSVKVTDDVLQGQVSKYRDALIKCLRQSNPDETDPMVDVICVLGDIPSGWENPRVAVEGRKSLEAKNIRVLTYQQLIDGAYSSYSEYFEKKREKGELQHIIRPARDDDS